MLDAELPAGAVPRAVPAVLSDPDVPVAVSARAASGTAAGGVGVAAPIGNTSAFKSVIGRDFVPPETQPVSVIVCGGATGACANAVTVEVSAMPQSTAVFMVWLPCIYPEHVQGSRHPDYSQVILTCASPESTSIATSPSSLKTDSIIAGSSFDRSTSRPRSRSRAVTL